MNVLISYLKFWWRSKNEHGVHSPFVFDLVTKCFYERTNHNAHQHLSKQDSKSKFLYRFGAYFKFDHCFIPDSIDSNHKCALALETTCIPYNTTDALINSDVSISKAPSCIYLNSETLETSLIKHLLKHCHRDSVIIIKSIRENQQQFEQWNQLKAFAEISVSIDTFYWGLLFLRSEQPKEHFTIRL